MPLIFILTFTFAQAQFFYTDSVINVPPFTQQIEAMGEELFDKTQWNVYLLTVDDIGERKMIAYEKNVSASLKAPFIMLTLAVKQQKVDIYGSEGYEKIIEKNSILRKRIYPILGAKMKGDVRYKYLEAMLNGYAEIVEQVASKHNVTLKTAIGNDNINTVNVLRVIFYGVIIGAFGIYFYRRFLRKRA